MAVLTLPLKTKWFDMIVSGEKTEEYRELGPYWHARLEMARECPPGCMAPQDFVFRKFEKVVFTLGYPKAGDSLRRIEFKNPTITVWYGRPEWGAEPGKLYYVITWEPEK